MVFCREVTLLLLGWDWIVYLSTVFGSRACEMTREPSCCCLQVVLPPDLLPQSHSRGAQESLLATPRTLRSLVVMMMYRGLRIGGGCFSIHSPLFFFSTGRPQAATFSESNTHITPTVTLVVRSRSLEGFTRHCTLLALRLTRVIPLAPLHPPVFAPPNMSKRTSASVKAEATAVVSPVTPMSEEKRKALQQYKDDDGHFSLVR